MQVKLVHFLQYILTLETIILCKLQNVIGFGTFSCVRESHFGQGHTRVTFLREEDTGLLLYATLWSDSMRLMTCEVHDNPLAIEKYWRFCNKSNEDERFTQRFNLNMTLSPNAPCVKTDAPNGDRSATQGKGKLRRKRSWTFPGTLWCGIGSKAFGFYELGMFESADRCCREHDHCHHIIPAFTVNYGVFNPNFYTVSHCDCDQRFRQCLLDVNDTISSMVLYSFFKILKVPCFELKLQKRCTKLYWWGMCKVTQEAPYAIFKKPIYYNTSFTSKLEKSDSSKSAANKAHLLTVQEIKPPRKKPRPEEKCISEDPPRGDSFFRIKLNDCRKNNVKQSTPAPYLHSTSLKIDISSKTKGLKSLSVHSAALITTNPYVKVKTTTPITALSSKRPDALQLTTASPRVIGHQISTEEAFQSQNKKSPLTRTFPAVTPTKDLALTWIFVSYDANATTAEPYTHYLESKTQNQVYSPLPAQATHHLSNSGVKDTKQKKSLLYKYRDFCESLKHLDGCRYKIPPLKERFGLKNLDTKPAYHCTCTKRLAREIQNLKQSSAPYFLMDLVSENCFKLPKRKKCRNRKSCSKGFSKASDLLRVLKKIEQNDIAGVRNSGKLRKGRISVQLYKRCLRLRKGAMAPLT